MTTDSSLCRRPYGQKTVTQKAFPELLVSNPSGWYFLATVVSGLKQIEL
jgi:hypothetical protein